MMTPIKPDIKKVEKKRVFYRIYEEGRFNGKLIVKNEGKLHYGYLPSVTREDRADNRRELLFLLKCHYNWPDLPGVWSYENLSGKTVVRVSECNGYSRKIKDNDHFVYECKRFAVEG